ncbi:hypothetical protein [Chryseotalea sanaruensis]|nr:hypothetical protein [Chryseotalea sanaruensis]
MLFGFLMQQSIGKRIPPETVQILMVKVPDKRAQEVSRGLD